MLAVYALGATFSDYSCSGYGIATVCTSTGTTTDFLFRSLQTQINQLSIAVGIVPISVDGQIGSETTKAIDAISTWLAAHNLSALPNAPGNIAATAANAGDLSNALGDAIQQVAAAGYPMASQTGDVVKSAPTTMSTGKKVAVGLATFALLGIGIAIIASRHK